MTLREIAICKAILDYLRNLSGRQAHELNISTKPPLTDTQRIDLVRLKLFGKIVPTAGTGDSPGDTAATPPTGKNAPSVKPTPFPQPPPLDPLLP